MSAGSGVMRVLICGGRDLDDKDGGWFNRISDYADQYGPFTSIIHGGARGADTLAGKWAAHHHLPCQVFRANWKRDRKAAGPIRNRRMLDEGKPNLVLALPGGRGTADMIAQAQSTPNVFVIDVARNPWPEWPA